MKVIAAVDNNWAIGKDNKLLVSIPADMKFFRETTTGHVVVMGRKTLESFPSKKPLPNRVNIVMTRDASYEVEGATIVHNEEELWEALAPYDTDEVFVIGGQSIYALLIDKCDVAYITKIDYSYDADAHFPNLDQMDAWSIVEESEEQTYFDLAYTFMRYEKN